MILCVLCGVGWVRPPATAVSGVSGDGLYQKNKESRYNTSSSSSSEQERGRDEDYHVVCMLGYTH